MSLEKSLKCDICDKVEDERTMHSESTLKVRAKAGWRLFWWRGRPDYSEMDICDECFDLIHVLRRKSDVSTAMNKIVGYRNAMCTADAKEFDLAVMAIAKEIDRYNGSHKEIYEALTKSQPVAEALPHSSPHTI